MASSNPNSKPPRCKRRRRRRKKNKQQQPVGTNAIIDLLQDANLPKRGLWTAGQRNVAKRVAKNLAEREPRMEEILLFRPGDVIR
jgi:hypothetical protein